MQTSPPSFVGRDEELAQFERAVETARGGGSTVLLIGGEAGIGKSSLVTEGARRAATELIVGRCIPMGGDLIPLAPLAELLRNVRRAHPDAIGEPGFSALRDWSARGPEASGPAAGGLFEPLLDLIARLSADDAVIVTFEDLHWADSLTWDLFDYLARNLVDEQVVLIGTYRANEVGTSPQQRHRLGEIARLPGAHRIHLGGLDRDALAEKIQTQLGKTPPPDLVDEILARGQGNPFFTAELVTAHESGQTIPTVLSDLIATELERLDATCRSVVSVIGAVGHDTPHELLMRVADLEAGQLETALHAAIAAQLVLVDSETASYRFRHALIGEVLYEGLLPPERTRLHGRIAEVLAEQAATLPSRADRASELAFHLDRAGDRPAAFTALLLAADAAETVAPAAALRHLERALELWDSAGEAAAAESRAARLWQAAELASGAAGNERAAALAREALRHGEPPRGAAWGHERLGRYLWASGHIEECADQFAAAAALLPAGAGPEAAPVLAGLGQAELMLGHYDSAETRARSALELLATPETDPGAWAMARRVVGIAVDHGGDPATGVDLCREAVETAPSATVRMLAVLYLGAAMLDAGSYQQAVTMVLDARAEARLTGLDRSFGGYLDALAVEGLIRLGQWSDAGSILDASEGTEAFPLGEMRLALAGALLAARRGERDRARGLLDQAESGPVDPFHRWFVDRTATEVHLAGGNWADAAAVAERALAREATPLWRARFVMLEAVAQVEVALDARARREPFDVDATLSRLDRRIGEARAAADGGPGPAVALDSAAHIAHAEATTTRLHDSDADAWAEAARRWAQLEDPYWLATARVREAEAAAAHGATARAAEALQEAHHLAVGIGAGPLLIDIEAVSRRTRLSLEAPPTAVLGSAAIEQLRLTPREAEVLSLVAGGQTNRQIGDALFVSEKTASVHVSNILRKLGVTSRVDAAAIAQRLGVS